MVSSVHALLLAPPPPPPPPSSFQSPTSSSPLCPPRYLNLPRASIARFRPHLQRPVSPPCGLLNRATISLRQSLRRSSPDHIVATKAASAAGAADSEGDPNALPPPPQDLSGDEPGEKKEKKGGSTLRLAIVFGFWYFQNVVFNIYNKKVLNIFPYPWLLASFQLFAGSLWMSALWLSGLYPFPRPLGRRFFLALLGPALFHTIGHISACVSFSKVAVSFTHVIKASEPVFSVVLSALLGVRIYPLPVWLSVLPIVGGCALAAITEVSFDVQGLWGALISNVGFVFRNIYSKKSLQDFAHVDGLNLYGWISIISLLYLFPVAVVVEGAQWAEGFSRALAAVPSSWTFFSWVLLSGIFYHLYNQSSYQALDEISPLTFSVGNTMKRVVVIVASVLVFRNPVRPLNALGSAIAIFGTFLYSQATAMGNKKNITEKKSSS